MCAKYESIELTPCPFCTHDDADRLCLSDNTLSLTAILYQCIMADHCDTPLCRYDGTAQIQHADDLLSRATTYTALAKFVKATVHYNTIY
jgi:hypothetical protein